MSIIKSTVRTLQLVAILISTLYANLSFGDVTLPIIPAHNENSLNYFVNGFSHHFKESNQNEVNYGLGIYYKSDSIDTGSDWFDSGAEWSLEFDAYSDSYKDFGFTGGIAWQKKLVGLINFGLKSGLIHEDKASSSTGLYLIPYIVPFLETRLNSVVDFRTTLIPPLGDVTDGYITLQLIINTDSI